MSRTSRSAGSEIGAALGLDVPEIEKPPHLHPFGPGRNVRVGDTVLVGEPVSPSINPARVIARAAMVIEVREDPRNPVGVMVAVFKPKEINICGVLPYSETLKGNHWTWREP